MESKRYFRIKEGANIDEESVHEVGGIYEMEIITDDFLIWLYDGVDPMGFPYYEYELEEVFDYGK